MKLASNTLLKVLGLLLLTGAVLKGWQLLTEPLANNDIWSNRLFLIFVVEFELALAIWLLSGLFKKAAWLVSLLCFSLFSMITLYKGITGAESCGCFGSVHVNPWITLFAIDLPSVIALSFLRPQLSLQPRMSFLPRIIVRGKLQRESIKSLIVEFFDPMPSFRRFATAFTIGLTILGVTTPILAFNEPARITSRYEVLEPSEWVGKELPILEHIDIAETLKKGTWLVMLYHYDCPDCETAIPKYEQMASVLQGNGDFLRIALIAVPPYGRYPGHKGPVGENSPCTLGRLLETKEWFVTTPAVALLTDSLVTAAWEEKAPDFETILQNFAKNVEISEKSIFFVSTNQLTHSPQRKEVRDMKLELLDDW